MTRTASPACSTSSGQRPVARRCRPSQKPTGSRPAARVPWAAAALVALGWRWPWPGQEGWSLFGWRGRSDGVRADWQPVGRTGGRARRDRPSRPIRLISGDDPAACAASTTEDGQARKPAACSSVLSLEWRGNEAAEEGRFAGPFSLPPGRYEARVWFDGGGRQRDGDLLLSLGRGNGAARATGPLGNPTTLTFELPIAVRSSLELSAPQTARAARTAEIVPLAIVPEPQRLIFPAGDRIDPTVRARIRTPMTTRTRGWRLLDAARLAGRCRSSRPARPTSCSPPRRAEWARLPGSRRRAHRQSCCAERNAAPVDRGPKGAVSVPISVQAPGSFLPIDVEPGSATCARSAARSGSSCSNGNAGLAFLKARPAPV